MRKSSFLLFFALFITVTATAQMWNGVDSLYGHEWIRYDQPYYKIKVATDGVYRLSYEVMQAQGVPVGGLAGNRLQLFLLGEEVPLYLSNEGILQPGDFLEFYGERHRAALDRHLFQNPDEEMLNPDYSLFSDTSVYFLTVAPAGTPTLRYTDVPNDLANLPAAEAWCWSTSMVSYTQAAVSKRYDLSGLVAYSIFEEGEGFGSPFLVSHAVQVPRPQYAVDAGQSSTLRLRLMSWRTTHHLSVSVDGAEVYNLENYPPYHQKNLAFDLEAGTGTETVVLATQGLIGTNDRYALGNVSLRYPRQMVFDTSFFAVEAPDFTQRRYFEIQAPGGAAVVLDPHNRRRIVPARAGGLLQFSVPPAPGASSAYLLYVADTEAGITQIETLTPKTFVPLNTDLTEDYFIISHAAFLAGQGSDDAVGDYADYRRSIEGGSYNVRVVAVEDLYDQFAYGIAQHPLAIKNYGNLVASYWEAPRYALLLGRGYEYTFARLGTGLYRHLNRLPAFGAPSSDNLLFSAPGSSVPRLAVGRLSAITLADVRAYLEKVKAHEAGFGLPRTVQNFGWRKKGLHLVGGKVNEQTTFDNYLAQMGIELTNNGFGATIETLKKITSEPVNSSPSNAAIDAVDAGVAIKTYLGHGAVTTTEDFAMDDPTAYNNTGKYPLILSLGCQTGNTFAPETSVSELFTKTPDRGGIGYIATSGYGFASALRDMGLRYYQLLGGEMYGQGMGDIMRRTRRLVQNNTWLGMRSLIDQLHLQGDPAVRINDVPAPDYTIDYASVKISPEIINVQADSIAIEYQIHNLGTARADTMAVLYERRLPDGTVQRFSDTITVRGGITDIRFRMPLMGEKQAGLNQLFISIDTDERIAEQPAPAAEQNNSLQGLNGETSLPFFVLDNTITPVAPPAFAIVGTPQVTLQASTSDAFAGDATYIFQIDTTARFSSPLRAEGRVQSKGGLVSWLPPLTFVDSTVYYWRVSPDSTLTQGADLPWAQRSFIHIAGSSEGWNQSHFFQFTEDELVNIGADEERQDFDFVNSNIGVIARAVRISPTNNTRSRVFLDNVRIVNATANPSITVVVFEPTKGIIWRARAFSLTNTTARRNAVIFLRDSIPQGYTSVVVTFHSPTTNFALEAWPQDSIDIGDNLYTVLEAEGSLAIRQLQDNGSLPFTFAFRKGLGPIAEDMAEPGTENAFIVFDILGRWPRGSITSTLAGPASNWQDLHWRFEIDPATPPDSTRFNVWGFDINGQNRTLLVDSLATPAFDLSFVDAAEFPFLQLEFAAQDLANRVAPTLHHWRIRHAHTGELALGTGTFYRDTLMAGETLRLDAFLHNVGSIDTDSVLVRYSIVTPSNERFVTTVKTPPALVQATLPLSFQYDTRNLRGRCVLIVEVNPERSHIERTYANNTGIIPFFVLGDLKNPLLDVTFDGIRILDGDLVSAAPHIAISLKDENPYLVLSDTSTFDIRLGYPDGSSRIVSFSDPALSFTPGTTQNNRASLLYSPTLEQDGLYSLRIKARDVTGNPAGSQDYQVRFEVITRRSISHVLPYPNPFTTATRFVYTLTGDEAPTFFMLRIMTVSGRVVREVNQTEFGALRVGTHLSDFVWDGTDQFGDRLANGVYLYQVISRNLQGEDFERYNNDKVDGYFKNNIGKVVLMR